MNEKVADDHFVNMKNNENRVADMVCAGILKRTTREINQSKYLIIL